MKMNNKSRIIAALGAFGSLALTVGYAQTPGAPPSNQNWWQGTQALRVADSSNMPGAYLRAVGPGNSAARRNKPTARPVTPA